MKVKVTPIWTQYQESLKVTPMAGGGGVLAAYDSATVRYEHWLSNDDARAYALELLAAVMKSEARNVH